MISLHHNIGGMLAMDALQQHYRVMQTAMERLSTGLRINRAEDDPAGLMLRDRFRAQVNGFEEGIRNIQTGQGMIQVAEQGINKVTEALQTMRALAVRAADDNLDDGDRRRVQEQVKGLLREINERAASTSYNGHKLLDGSIADAHEARLGSAKVLGGSLLASGRDLVRGVATTGSSALTASAISQGSYEVRLVFSDQEPPGVNAVVYFSDGGGALSPISTLTGLDTAARTYSAGGVSFTLERASTLDVGLTSYVKTHAFVSATRQDRSLTFQVGPDQGNVTRVGISRLDTRTIFRGTSPDLSDALKAQDMIGMIDDALDFVSGENLKVGQFQNKFSRTLEMSRQQMTSMTGALSLLEDADMAKEATVLSKRSILVQSATAMVAQANAQGQFLLQLLR